ncbi:phosphatidate cytidylyltransferase [Qipengyuania sp. DSG2-2]|uniref:phosphatidate cytidylyltransferase n=1 Tax=Qipengyuania sp. DGS2-2 TaxID=3349631 RepID=UPI0036D37AAC
MVDAEVQPKKKSDLGVRLVSALVMLAVLFGAFAAGELWFDAFVVAVTLVTFAEFVRLVLKATDNPAYRIAGIVAGAFYIGLAGMVIVGLDSYYLLAAVGVVIATDVGAYFMGRGIGGPKIAPSISPSKTWAGLFGGMLLAAVFLILMVGAFHYTSGYKTWGELFAVAWPDAAGAAVVGAILAITAQFGDFFQSWLKRKAGVKDSSNLIPGHGGFFDRTDGLLPVALIAGFIGATFT